MGVKTGQPIWEVREICPEAVFVKRDFRWYEVLSRTMLTVLHEVSPLVEYYSIDEFFFDAGELPNVFRLSLEDAGRALQRRILDEIGVSVSMGISYSRTLAKLASDINKPLGVTILLDRPTIDEFLSRQPVSEISGIAARSAAKLETIGVRTCLDLMNADRLAIRRLLTITGEAIWYELHGESVIPIHPVRARSKRIGRGGSFGEKTNDPARLNAWLARNTERLVEELQRQRVVCGRLFLGVEYVKFGGWGGTIRFHYPTDAFEVLLSASQALLRRALSKRPIDAMHVEAELLTPRAARQLSLFPLEGNANVAAVKSDVNAKLGRFALRSAATLPLTAIYTDEANDYDICDVAGKTCF